MTYVYLLIPIQARLTSRLQRNNDRAPVRVFVCLQPQRRPGLWSQDRCDLTAGGWGGAGESRLLPSGFRRLFASPQRGLAQCWAPRGRRGRRAAWRGQPRVSAPGRIFSVPCLLGTTPAALGFLLGAHSIRAFWNDPPPPGVKKCAPRSQVVGKGPPPNDSKTRACYSEKAGHILIPHKQCDRPGARPRFSKNRTHSAARRASETLGSQGNPAAAPRGKHGCSGGARRPRPARPCTRASRQRDRLSHT